MSDEQLRPGAGRTAAVIARHESDLLRRANVVAVSERQGGGITIYVVRKMPSDQLAQSDLLPSELEGIPVEVVESGSIEAQDV